MLYINNITKTYCGKTVLSNITFNIEKNKVLGIIGPNGGGKSTIIKLLLNIIQPDSGTINFSKSYDKSNHTIGYLPEERGLYKDMKVKEHIIYIALMKGLSYKQASQNTMFYLKRFNILNWSNKVIGQLSKGMQQKVQFICAIINSPDLLILDEPLSGLDPNTKHELCNEISLLKKTGTTIIFSSHNMDVIESLCDNIIFIKNGEIILSGNTNTITHHYKKNMYELVCTNVSRAFISEVLHIASFKETEYQKDSIILTIKSINKLDLEKLIFKYYKEMNIVSYREIRPSLKDIYIKIINIR